MAPEREPSMLPEMQLRPALAALVLGCGCAATAPDPRPVVSPAPSAVAVTPVPPAGPSAVREGAEAETAPEPSPVEPKPAAAPRFQQPLAPRSTTRAIVLLYHAFNRGAQPLSVRASDFDRQLQWLQDNHVEIVSTSELVGFLAGDGQLPARVALITIDDGLKSVYEKAWPILKRRQVRFTLGIPTGMLEEPKNAPVMTWAQVREMVSSGLCEVASHGHMHRRLVGLSGRKQREELELSRELITQRIGQVPVAYFYPLGAYDGPSAEAVQVAGYSAAFRASGAPIAAGSGSLFWLPRLSVFHGERAGPLSHYFSERFLGQVSYVARRDPASRNDEPDARRPD